MRRYEEYKDSDVTWFGEIPKNWNIARLKDFSVNVKTGSTPSSSKGDFFENGTENWYTPSDINNSLIINSSRKLSKYAFNIREVHKFPANCIYLIGIGGTLGKVGFSNVEASCNQQINVIQFNKNYDFKYGFYLMLVIGNTLIKWSNYTTMPIFTQTNTKNLLLIAPPFSEQQAIADYLDAKTQAIDKKVSLLEQKVETYKKLKRTLINQTITKGLDKNVPLKDSGISWIGQIPEHWEVKRFKDIVKIVNGYAFKSNDFSDEGISVLRISDITKSDFSDLKKVPTFYETLAKESKVFKEDILMAMTGATIGKNTFFNADDILYLNQRVCSFRSINKNQLLPFYFSLYISSDFVQNLIRLISSGSAQENISKSQLEVFKIVVPPKSEQQAIADYLDAKTQAIDKKVSLLEQKVETYKKLKRTLINQTITKGLDKNVPLKDSGISWIGQIPQHWEVKRFKSFADTIKGKNLEVFDNQIEGTLPNLSLEYLRNDSVGFEAFVKTNNRNLIVNENDLIIVWDGAGVGEILNGKVGVISSTIAKLKFNKSLNAKFFSFIRYDLEYRLKQIPTGMGIPHLNPHELKNFMCPIPPKSEQQEIAKYLDHKTTTIDAIVHNIGKQVETLKRLRKTLINDVVTGKIKVCDDKK